MPCKKRFNYRRTPDLFWWRDRFLWLQKFENFSYKAIDFLLTELNIESYKDVKKVEKGEFIGEIRLAQRLLKYPVSAKEKLAWKSMDELRIIFQRLEPELKRS